jgi:ribokinase
VENRAGGDSVNKVPEAVNRNRQLSGDSVLVVGSINEDVVLVVPRAPKPGETLTADQVTRRAGGKGANQAVAAARARADVRMIGRVGQDAAGERLLADLRSERVDTELVRALPDTATGTAYITVTVDGENTIVVDPGANASLSRRDVEEHGDAFASAAVMLAQLEVPIETVTAAVRLAIAAGTRPIVTLSPVQDVPGELLEGLDPLLVNEHEAAALLADREPARDPESSAERLLRRGPESVVITLGSRGAVFAHSGGVSALSARPVDEVVDTTGAGDAFAGALAAALAGGASLKDAVRAGLAAGALAITREGAH